MTKFLVRWLVILAMLPGLACAQALPVSSMQKAVSTLIQNKAIKRGFAANDPRIASTLQTAGSGIAGAATAAAVITLAGVTAPAWITAGLTVGLGVLFAAGIDLAIDGIKLLLNSDGSVSGQGTSSGPLVSGGAYWVFRVGGGIGYGSTALAAVYAARPFIGNKPVRCTPNSFTPNTSSCEYLDGKFADGKENWLGLGSANYLPSGSPCSSVNGACRDDASPVVIPSEVIKYSNFNEAVSKLSSEQRTMPVNPQIVAALADSAWKQAASQPGYAGLPYDASNPISAADAAALQQSSPTTWPTVGDVVSPQENSTGGGSPWSLPDSNASTPPAAGGNAGGDPPTETGPTIDWTIPSFGDQIPKQSVVSSFVPTVFAAPTGCPAPITFQMFGKSHNISYGPFCDLMATLAPLFLATGAAAAALIFAQSLKS